MNGKKAYKLVESLLIARRNQNIRAEQKAYEALRDWCHKNQYDMNQVIDEVRRYMLEKEVAPAMNGLV